MSMTTTTTTMAIPHLTVLSVLLWTFCCYCYGCCLWCRCCCCCLFITHACVRASHSEQMERIRLEWNKKDKTFGFLSIYHFVYLKCIICLRPTNNTHSFRTIGASFEFVWEAPNEWIPKTKHKFRQFNRRKTILIKVNTHNIHALQFELFWPSFANISGFPSFFDCSAIIQLQFITIIIIAAAATAATAVGGGGGGVCRCCFPNETENRKHFDEECNYPHIICMQATVGNRIHRLHNLCAAVNFRREMSLIISKVRFSSIYLF